MFLASLSATALLYATYGQHICFGGVINITNAGLNKDRWHVLVYCGGPDERQIKPAFISCVDVDGKAKDPVTGRLLIDEMRELLKSKEIVLIHFNSADRGAMAVGVEKHTGLKLNLESPP